MANEQATLVIGNLLANADLSTTGRYRFGKINSSAKIALAGADARAEGVIQNKPAADQPVNLGVGGVLLVEVGAGGCTAGGNVASGASGVAVTADSGAMVLGTFLMSGSAGDVVPILFNPAGPIY